jgi:N-acetylglutamate synthase-like GNAT family acetyltransferase
MTALDAGGRVAHAGIMTHADLTFRSANPDDAAAIRALVRAAYAKCIPIIGREPRPMQADYEAAVREHDFELAQRDGEMIALIETMLHDDHLWIENIAVAPVAQGQGLGTLLLERSEARAHAADRPELRLLTNGKMDVNIALYRRVGFNLDKEEPFGDGTVVYMSKRLTG